MHVCRFQVSDKRPDIDYRDDKFIFLKMLTEFVVLRLPD